MFKNYKRFDFWHVQTADIGGTKPWKNNCSLIWKLFKFLMTLLAGLFEMRGCWHIGLRWAIVALWATCLMCPGAGADNPFWTKSWCQQKSLVTLPICCKFQKKYLWSLIYVIFMFLCMYIALGQGQTTPWGQNFYFNINLLSLQSFAVSFVH